MFVELKYIKDNQKHFLYNPNIETSNKNYTQNSILLVINSNTLDCDSYLTYLTSKFFLPHINDIKNQYNELKHDIDSAGLSDSILTTPLLYSSVDEYLYTIKNQLIIYIFLVVILIGIEVALTVFMILNYLERNKVILSVKKIHGFSFYKRHEKFLIVNFIFWFAIYIGAVSFEILQLSNIIFYLLFTLVLELILIIITIRITESNKNKDILKGA